MAFVKTGMGGRKVVLDGGCLILPVVHQVVEVWLNTRKLIVRREAHDALICGDKLRADIEAEFYIRVQPDDKGINAASQTLGNKTSDETFITQLVEQKLVNALRSIAAKMPLQQLNTERVEFAKAVLEALAPDLMHNGLILESVTISRLDQTPYDENAPVRNIFDAEGRMTAASIISKNSIAENEFRRDAEQSIAKKNAETIQVVTAQEFEQNKSVATRDANTAMAVAEQTRTAEVFKATQQLETEQARLATAQLIGQRDALRDQEIRVAKVNADQAAQTAAVRQDQAVEVAGREKEIAVAEAEKRRADAQAEQLKAEQSKTTEAQGVITVEATAKAEREKKVQVIEAQKTADVKQTAQNREADMEAYKLQTVATGQLKATEQDASARKIKAEAEREALTAEAEGQSKVASVPVNVKAREVEVDSQRVETVDRPTVEVLKSRLAAQNEFTSVSVELEKFKLLMDAMARIEIAKAEAMGQALGSSKMSLFGNPEMLANVAKGWSTGMGVNALFESLMGGNGQAGSIGKLLSSLLAAKPGNSEQAEEAATGIDNILAELAERFAGNKKIAGLVQQIKNMATAAAVAPEETSPAVT